MTELVSMLGTLSALVTFVGIYRFANFFFNRGPEIALLLSLSATVIFLLLFDMIILLLGAAVVASPFAAAAYLYGIPTSYFDRMNASDSSDEGDDSDESDTDDSIECPDCGEQNKPDRKFCEDCGYKLDS